jgi:hypothetical protein
MRRPLLSIGNGTGLAKLTDEEKKQKKKIF